MNDFRLYYYENGQLRKWSNRKGQYIFENVEDADKFVELKNSKTATTYQWVLTDYYGPYRSKIIKVYD